MEGINKFLERFKKLAVPNEKVRKKLSEIIEEDIGAKIEIKDISIKGETAYIRGDGMVRSEIFLNKKKILDNLKINSKEGDDKITNIR